VLQRTAVCCSLLQSVAACCTLLHSVALCCSLLQSVDSLSTTSSAGKSRQSTVQNRVRTKQNSILRRSSLRRKSDFQEAAGFVEVTWVNLQESVEAEDALRLVAVSAMERLAKV